MAAGLQVTSEANTYQIDSDYSNIFLNRKVEISSSTPVDLGLADDEIVCIKPNKGESVSVPYYAFAKVGFMGSGVAYIFKNQPVSPMKSGDAGLEVYKPDGSIAYNSKSKPLRIVGNFIHGSNSVVDVSIPQGVKSLGFLPVTAMVVTVPAVGEQLNSTWHNLLTTFVTLSDEGAHQLRRGSLGAWNSPVNYPTTINPSTKGFLVDLSGY